MRHSFILAIAILLSACGEKAPKPAEPPLPAGEARLAVPGGRIWYKVSGAGNGTPVVLLHGGPGFSSYYLKPFEDLGDDRAVIRYDQLGGGKSDRISDTTMFTIEHFVRELDSLRSHLGYQRWHVFGHSWGTILAMEYYRAHPDRVASLTFGSAVFDAKAYVRRANQLVTTLSDSAQQAIKRADAAQKYGTPDYQNAVGEFYAKYLWRHPPQADLDSTMATVNEAIYNYMQGPSEFVISGTLKDYDATGFLPQIKVPTLFTVGEFDEVGPELIKGFAAKVPHARYVEFPGSAHLTPWDARDENVKAVRGFLRAADSTASK
jgi:proline iminopeptidase